MLEKSRKLNVVVLEIVRHGKQKNFNILNEKENLNTSSIIAIIGKLFPIRLQFDSFSVMYCNLVAYCTNVLIML